MVRSTDLGPIEVLASLDFVAPLPGWVHGVLHMEWGLRVACGSCLSSSLLLSVVVVAAAGDKAPTSMGSRLGSSNGRFCTVSYTLVGLVVL